MEIFLIVILVDFRNVCESFFLKVKFLFVIFDYKGKLFIFFISFYLSFMFWLNGKLVFFFGRIFYYFFRDIFWVYGLRVRVVVEVVINIYSIFIIS